MIGGDDGAWLAFDPGGAPRWTKLFRKPLLIFPSVTNLSDGSICAAAWAMGKQGVLKRLRVMQLDQRGNVVHAADINALRGQVAAGLVGSCAVLYDRDRSNYKGQYYLTVFDRSFARRWTVPVRATWSGAEFHLVPLAEGYLAQIDSFLVEYSWSGKEL